MTSSITYGLFLLGSVIAAAKARPDGRTIQVDVRYTGAGTVNASHKIYVALWDDPGFASPGGDPPVAVQPLDSASGTVTFSNVQKVPAYISVAYDPTGSWDAQSPPPSGTSLGMYTTNPPKPEPISVDSGKTVKITLTFDDAMKVP